MTPGTTRARDKTVQLDFALKMKLELELECSDCMQHVRERL
jgi:hypothetical protein